MDRATQLTKYLRNYDRELYCAKSREGKLCVYRNSKRFEEYDLNGVRLLVARSSPHFILALTHNWQMTGQSADWGFLPLYERIKAIDTHNRNLAEDVIEQVEKSRKEKERKGRNDAESFFSEFRGQFKKTFSDFNTSSMDKKDRRRKDDIDANH